jgi:hypothetical protein
VSQEPATACTPRTTCTTCTQYSLECTAELEQFFDDMAQERFDLAIQIHGGGRYSNPFLLRLGARMNVGLKTPDAVPLDRWVSYIYYQPEILRYLEVVSLVGAAPIMLESRISVIEEDLLEALGHQLWTGIRMRSSRSSSPSRIVEIAPVVPCVPMPRESPGAQSPCAVNNSITPYNALGSA